MATKEIQSLTHPMVKYARSLRTSKKERREKGQVLIAGTKMAHEVGDIDSLFAEKGQPLPKAKETYLVTPEILKKITGLASPEPLAAIVSLPKEDTLMGKSRILVLDGISDPGNLGTLIRTALALGWEGVFLTENCADLFNDKALRSAKGATFRLPYRQGSREELVAFLKGEKRSVLVADMHGPPLPEISSSSPLALILGSEAHGASPLLKAEFPLASIPIEGIESLNVAAAGAIFMYTLGI